MVEIESSSSCTSIISYTPQEVAVRSKVNSRYDGSLASIERGRRHPNSDRNSIQFILLSVAQRKGKVRELDRQGSITTLLFTPTLASFLLPINCYRLRFNRYLAKGFDVFAVYDGVVILAVVAISFIIVPVFSRRNLVKQYSMEQ